MKPAAGALLFTLAVTLGGPTAVEAQQWTSGGPVYRSDIERREQQAEAARAALRKTHVVKYPAFMKGGEKPEIEGEAPPYAYLEQNEQPGTIIIDTQGRRLYYVLTGGKAYAYPISVGRIGFTWTGTEKISRIATWPTWTPPSDMRRRQPGLPVTVTGGLINPLGARALYLGNSIYRIHGTNNPRSIGRASSSGCFRMMNKHVIHLAGLARTGTKVRVASSYSGASDSAPLSSLFSGFGSPEPAGAKKPDAKKAKKKNAIKKKVAKKPDSEASGPAATAVEKKASDVKPADVKPAETQPAAISAPPRQAADSKASDTKVSNADASAAAKPH